MLATPQSLQPCNPPHTHTPEHPMSMSSVSTGAAFSQLQHFILSAARPRTSLSALCAQVLTRVALALLEAVEDELLLLSDFEATVVRGAAAGSEGSICFRFAR